LKTFLFLFLYNSFVYGLILSASWKDAHLLPLQTEKIKVLDIKELVFPQESRFYGISDLAYKNEKLYALSDKGVLFLLSLKIQNEKISSLQLKQTYLLKNKKNKILKKNKTDAEGLCFKGDNLLISFERKHRIDLYNTKGQKLQKIKLHPYLQNKKHFLRKNKGLESVIYSKKYGILTTPELEKEGSSLHTLFSQKKLYRFFAKGSVTALEFINENTLLVLTREFHYVTRKRVTQLYSLYLDKCKDEKCRSEELASFKSEDGFNIDNFEGLTKVSKNRYLMISDDNGSFLQKTLIVLFEVIP